MPEHLRARRDGIDRLLQHVLAGVVGDPDPVNVQHDELQILLEALPIAILISRDRDCARIWGNAAARRLYQLPEGQNFSRSAPDAELPPFEIYADGRPAAAEDLPLQRAARTGRPVAKSECEIRFHDGRRIYLAGHSIPIRNDLGEVTGSMGAFLDLTPLRRELESAQMISREMSHRLRNTVAIIQTISRRTLRPLLPPDVFAAYEARLVSLSKCQEILGRPDQTDPKLAQILEAASDGVVAAGRISAAGPDLPIPASTALPLGMILHELATNAMKYGALAAQEGTVRVTWEVLTSSDQPEVRLQWLELDGPTIAAPTRTGFGTQLIEAIAQSLPDGRFDLDFAPEGLRVALGFRAAEAGAPAQPEP